MLGAIVRASLQNRTDTNHLQVEAMFRKGKCILRKWHEPPIAQNS